MLKYGLLGLGLLPLLKHPNLHLPGFGDFSCQDG